MEDRSPRVILIPLKLRRELQEAWCMWLWKLPITHAGLNLHPKEVPVAFVVFPNYPGKGRLQQARDESAPSGAGFRWNFSHQTHSSQSEVSGTPGSSPRKVPVLIPSCHRVPRGITCVTELHQGLATSHLESHVYERTNIVLQLWAFGRGFLANNQQSILVPSKAQLFLIPAVKVKLKSWGPCICQHGLDSLPIIKGCFRKISCDSNTFQCMLHNKTYASVLQISEPIFSK